MLLPTRPPSWVSICTIFALTQVTTCIPLTPSLPLSISLSSPDVSLSQNFHPLDPPLNTSTSNNTLTTWPSTPFDIVIPHLDTPTILTVVSTGDIDPAADKKWLLAAIAYQQSVYRKQGHKPKGFNIWNDTWRFYMELGQTPLTMAIAVRSLQVFEGLVEAYGMVRVAFLVRVGEDVRGFYWVTLKGAGVGVDVV